MPPVENKRYTVGEFEFPPPDYPLAICAAYNRLNDTAVGYADMKSFICFDAGFRAALDFMEQKLTEHNRKSTPCLDSLKIVGRAKRRKNEIWSTDSP